MCLVPHWHILQCGRPNLWIAEVKVMQTILLCVLVDSGTMPRQSQRKQMAIHQEGTNLHWFLRRCSTAKSWSSLFSLCKINCVEQHTMKDCMSVFAQLHGMVGASCSSLPYELPASLYRIWHSTTWPLVNDECCSCRTDTIGQQASDHSMEGKVVAA